MNIEFVWDRNSLFQADTVSSVPCLIEKNIVRESVIKMKNGKAAGPSRVVSYMLKAAGEAGVHMITDLVNQIIVERIIPVEWYLNTIINFYNGKRDSLEKGN